MSSRNFSTKTLLLATALVLVLTAGIWFSLASKSPDQQSTDSGKNREVVVNSNNGEVISVYLDPQARFQIPFDSDWMKRVDGDTVTLWSGDLTLNLRVVAKEQSTSFMQYVESQTTKAAVGEGTYERLVEEKIGDFDCVRAIGTYVGRFLSEYCALSGREVLVVSSAFTDESQLTRAKEVISRISK